MLTRTEILKRLDHLVAVANLHGKRIIAKATQDMIDSINWPPEEDAAKGDNWCWRMKHANNSWKELKEETYMTA
jgi:hypothetical protein